MFSERLSPEPRQTVLGISLDSLALPIPRNLRNTLRTSPSPTVRGDPGLTKPRNEGTIDRLT
jgi:hypothetical protein